MPSVPLAGFVKRRRRDDVLISNPDIDSRFVAVPLDAGAPDDFDVRLGKEQMPAAGTAKTNW